MKQRFWLFRRGETFYLQDSDTGKKESLHTKDPRHAEQLRNARNEAASKPMLGLTIGRAYLSAYDPALLTRTWDAVMVEFVGRGKASSRIRRERAMKVPAFVALRTRRIIDTTPDDLRAALAGAGASTIHFLRCLHGLAVGMGYLPWAIIPPKLWPKPDSRDKRAITADEHRQIIEAEGNVERRAFYEMAWETGAAQTDVALLTAEKVDWKQRTLSYQRCKTGEWAHLAIGTRLEALLRRLPTAGALFPHISTTTASARAAEFNRRCRVLKIRGISLHSYRYAWAQRAKENGYPQRWAQNALGHKSKAVHESYAKGAVAVCPSLENYEQSQNPAHV